MIDVGSKVAVSYPHSWFYGETGTATERNAFGWHVVLDSGVEIDVPDDYLEER